MNSTLADRYTNRQNTSFLNVRNLIKAWIHSVLRERASCYMQDTTLVTFYIATTWCDMIYTVIFYSFSIAVLTYHTGVTQRSQNPILQLHCVIKTILFTEIGSIPCSLKTDITIITKKHKQRLWIYWIVLPQPRRLLSLFVVLVSHLLLLYHLGNTNT